MAPSKGSGAAPVGSAAEDSDDDIIAPLTRFSSSKRMLLTSTISFIHKSIRPDPEADEQLSNRELFRAFQEAQYHHNKALGQILEPFRNTLQDVSPVHVADFILKMLHLGDFDICEFIISVLYIERFRKSTGLPLYASMWRPLFLVALLLADKMWEDKSVKNSSLTMLFPVLTCSELNDLEIMFLKWLGFTAWLTRREFQKFCEGLLLSEGVAPEIMAQVCESPYLASLQDARSSGTAASGAPPWGKPGRPEQPWHARNTLHDARLRRPINGLVDKAPSAEVTPGVLHAVASTSSAATSTASPNSAPPGMRSSGSSSLRALAPSGSAASSGAGAGLASTASPPSASPPSGSAAATAELTPVREGGSTTLAQSPRQISTTTQQLVAERRTASEPRVSSQSGVQAQASSGGAYGIARTQNPIHVQQQSSDVRAVSPTTDPALLPFTQKAQLFAGAGAAAPPPKTGSSAEDRHNSEPAPLARPHQGAGAAAGAGAWAGARAGGNGLFAGPQPCGQHPAAQAVSAAGWPCQQHLASGRNTMPAFTQRAALPQGAQTQAAQVIAGGLPGGHQRLGIANGGSSHAPCGPSHLGGSTLLGRGRSSSPAGVTDAQATAPPARHYPSVATHYTQSSIAVMGAQARSR